MSRWSMKQDREAMRLVRESGPRGDRSENVGEPGGGSQFCAANGNLLQNRPTPGGRPRLANEERSASPVGGRRHAAVLSTYYAIKWSAPPTPLRRAAWKKSKEARSKLLTADIGFWRVNPNL